MRASTPKSLPKQLTAPQTGSSSRRNINSSQGHQAQTSCRDSIQVFSFDPCKSACDNSQRTFVKTGDPSTSSNSDDLAAELMEIIKQDPTSPVAYQVLVEHLISQGRLVQAREVAETSSRFFLRTKRAHSVQF